MVRAEVYCFEERMEEKRQSPEDQVGMRREYNYGDGGRKLIADGI
jgi:hypothetical protein